MEENSRDSPGRTPVGIRITDLSLRREQMALNCRFQSVCYAYSKNCHTCPRRGGAHYSVTTSEDGLQGSWESLVGHGLESHNPANASELDLSPARER